MKFGLSSKRTKATRASSEENREARLIKEQDRLGGAFHSIGTMLQHAETMAESDQAKFSHVTVANAYTLMKKLSEARKQLAEAESKKKQFGL